MSTAEAAIHNQNEGRYTPPSPEVMEEMERLLQPGLRVQQQHANPDFNPRSVRYVMSVAVPEMRVDARWTGTNGYLGRYRLIPLESYFLEESNDTPEGLLDREKSKRTLEWTAWDNVVCLIDQNAQYGAAYLTALTGVDDRARAARIVVAALGGIPAADVPVVDMRAFLENRDTDFVKGATAGSSASIRRMLGTPQFDEHLRPTNDAARAERCREALALAHEAGERHLRGVWFDSLAKVAQKRKSKLDQFDYYCAKTLRITPPERELAEASKQMAAGALEQNAALVRDVVTAVMQQTQHTSLVPPQTVNTAEIDAKLAELHATEERVRKMLEGAQASAPVEEPKAQKFERTREAQEKTRDK